MQARDCGQKSYIQPEFGWFLWLYDNESRQQTHGRKDEMSGNDWLTVLHIMWWQGRTVFYQHVVVEYSHSPKQAIMVKCDLGLTPNRNSSYDSEVSEVSLVKRQADFVNFHEE